MKIDLAVIEYLHVNCVRNYAIHNAIQDFFNNIASENNFWRVVQNSTFDIAVIDWCKLFGSAKETTHWKNNGVSGILDFDEQILSLASIKTEEWKTTWKEINDYRNKNAAHIDFDDLSRVVPYVGRAIDISFISFDVFATQNHIVGKDIRSEYELQYRLTLKEITS